MEIPLTASLSELQKIFGIKEEFLFKLVNLYTESAHQMTGIEFLENFLAIDIYDVDQLYEMFEDEYFLARILDFYNDQPVELVDAVRIIFYAWVYPIEKETIDNVFDLLPMNSLSPNVYSAVQDGCSICPPDDKKLIIKGFNGELEIATLFKEKLLQGEVLVYHGSNSETWFDWMYTCDVTNESTTTGDFHYNQGVTYFQYKMEGARSRAWKAAKTGMGYLVIVFAVKKDKLCLDKSYKHVVGEEWEKVVKGFRMRDSRVKNEYRSSFCIEGAMLSNPQSLGNDDWKPEILEGLGDQICVKNVQIFQKYFRFLGQVVYIKR